MYFLLLLYLSIIWMSLKYFPWTFCRHLWMFSKILEMFIFLSLSFSLLAYEILYLFLSINEFHHNVTGFLYHNNLSTIHSSHMRNQVFLQIRDFKNNIFLLFLWLVPIHLPLTFMYHISSKYIYIYVISYTYI